MTGKTKLLAILPFLSLIFGCLEYGPGRGPESGSALFTIHALASLAVAFAWFWIDAREWSYRPPIVLVLAMLVLTFVALPYYLFRSRGLLGGARALGLAGLVFAVTMAAYRVGSWFA